MREPKLTPIVFTKRQIREMFQVSDRALERWVKNGRFPKPILPGRWDRSVILRHFAPSSDTAQENIRQGDLRL